jgi:hypothetical protein
MQHSPAASLDTRAACFFPGSIFPEIALEEKLIARGSPCRPRRNKLEMMHAAIGPPRHPG